MCSASSDTSSRSLSAGAGSSASFGAERRAAAAPGSAVGSRSVTVRRHEAPPTSRAQSASFPRRAPRAFRSGEQAVEQHPEPSPERQLVGRLLPGTRASRAGRQPAVVAAPSRPAPPSPGSRRAGRPAPIVRRRRHPAARQAVRSCELPAPPAPRSGRARAAAACSGSGARNERVRSSETISACPGRATFAAASAAKRRSAAPARASQAEPDRRERPLERRLEAAVEPLDAPSSRRRPFPARPARRRSPRPRAAAGSPPTPARPSPGPARRARAAGTSRAPPRAASPAARPCASAAPVTEPTSGSLPGSGASAAGLACSLGRRRSAARRSKAGMTTEAITGTYVLHEHVFPCQE